VIVYDVNGQRYWELDDPAEELRELGFTAEESYPSVCAALGIKPIIDI
jgi:hypothetical protein